MMISEGTPTTPAGTGTLAAVLLENNRFAPADAKTGEVVVTTDTTGGRAKAEAVPGPPPVRTASPSTTGMSALALAPAFTAVTEPLTEFELLVLGATAAAVEVAATALTVASTDMTGGFADATDMALGAATKLRPPVTGAGAAALAVAVTALTVTFLMAVTTGGRALLTDVALRANAVADVPITLPLTGFKATSTESPTRGDISTSSMTMPL